MTGSLKKPKTLHSKNGGQNNQVLGDLNGQWMEKHAATGFGEDTANINQNNTTLENTVLHQKKQAMQMAQPADLSSSRFFKSMKRFNENNQLMRQAI